MEQNTCPKCGTKVLAVLVTSLVVGLVVGYFGGNYYGFNKGVASEKERLEMEEQEAEKKAVEAVNPFTSKAANPFENAPTNPFEDVKVNPFE